jgi:O-antigen/teichoic acid export membrane protein
MMNKYARLGKNTILVFIGNAGAKLISLVMLPFYTRWLSVEDYGVTDIINVYVTLLLGLSTACIAEAVFIFPKGQPLEKQKSYFSSGLIFAFFTLLFTAFVFIVTTRVFEFKKLSNSFTDNAWFVYWLLATTFFQQYIQQFARSIDKMKIYSVTGVVLTACTALFSFILIPRWGVFGYVFALILAHVSAALYCLLFTGAFKFFAFKSIEKSTCMEMVRYTLPLVPNTIMWWLVGAFNRPLMEYHLGMYAIGIFGVANRFSGIQTALFNIFSQSWTISVLEEFGKEGYSYFFNKMFRLIVTGLMFLFFIITISSKLIVTIFTGPNFYEAWKYIPILTFGVIFSNISALIGSNFAGAKKSKYFLYSSIWVIVSSVIFNILLIPRFGIMGAAIAAPLSFAVMAVSRIIYAWKYVKINNISHYAIMLLLGIAMIFTMLSIQSTGLKIASIALLFSLFIGVNYQLKNDVVNGIYLVKSILVKKTGKK